MSIESCSGLWGRFHTTKTIGASTHVHLLAEPWVSSLNMVAEPGCRVAVAGYCLGGDQIMDEQSHGQENQMMDIGTKLLDEKCTTRSQKVMSLTTTPY